MRWILKVPVLILIASLLTACKISAGEGDRYTLEDLNWIMGSWQMDARGSTIVESWEKVGEKTYEGYSYTISLVSNDTTFAESLRIVEMAGEIYYIADVNHNLYPTPFKLVQLDNEGAVFENEEHDFPQRIEYHVETTGALKVVVSGTDKLSDQDKTLEFHFKKKE